MHAALGGLSARPASICWAIGGSIVVLVLLGMSAGMFAIPVQVFIQIRPPDRAKGPDDRRHESVQLHRDLSSAGPIYKLFDTIVIAA